VDDAQRRGLGRLLVTMLAAAARERGVTKFRVEVMRTNEAATGLLRDFDADAVPVVEEGVAVYELTIPPVPGEEPGAPLFGFLRLAARGLTIVLRRLGSSPG
jgi:ribosomal protein S18 acetylase RimI-like enzyme